MLSIGQRLGQIRLEQRIRQQDAAQAIGVAPSTMCLWDSDRRHPTIGNAAAYARFLGRRLVALDGGQVVAEGEELAHITRFRTAAGVSRSELAERLGVDLAAVCCVERTAGPATHLSTVHRYLGALGYRVGLAPAVETAVAA